MNITIMQSCNGLLLLEGKPLKNPTNPLKARHFIYNPTTNQHVAVNFPTLQFRFTVLSLYLSFEPLKSPYFKIISIRFKDVSSINDSFKYAMRAAYLNINPDYVVNVYSSETGSWSEPGVSFTVPVLSDAVYCNGAIYWWLNDKAGKSKYFDVENHCFKKFPMPFGIITYDQTTKYFGESGGRLHVVVQSILDFEVDVLELNEDPSAGWSVRFHMDLDFLMAACPLLSLHDFRLIDIFCVVRQGEKDEESMLVFSINERFIACTLLNQTVKLLSSFSPFLSTESRCDVFHYYENLSSVTPSN